MKGLFYFPKEKILLYIPDYYTNGTGILSNLIENLKAAESILRHFQPVGNIYSSEITKSRRYLHMWEFHTSLDTCPKEAYEISGDWTVNQWIEN